MTTQKIKFLYRDAENYKFLLIREIQTEKPLSIGDEIEYTSIGITQEEFHNEIIEHPYNSDSDHNLLEVYEIIEEGQPVFDADKLNAQIENVNFNLPNGFTSWHETHFEIVEAITVILLQGEVDNHREGIVWKKYNEQGHGGMYELAQELTDEFENTHIGVDWGNDEDWYDTIEAFIKEKLYS